MKVQMHALLEENKASECLFQRLRGEDKNLSKEEEREEDQKNKILIPNTLFKDITLRKYQINGIRWLLRMWNDRLHCILADDMGLGKTVQLLAFLACCRLQKENSPGRTVKNTLIVCPLSLVQHWRSEINRMHSDMVFTSVVMYVGALSERKKLRPLLPFTDLIITSYQTVRTDIEYLQDVCYSFIALDEGHIMRNHKAETAQAVYQLHGSFRVILTGTPIQNSVEELWSMFEFLLPGYLGTYASFSKEYIRPIKMARKINATCLDLQNGTFQMEMLQKRVYPFILQRKKTEVLQDLPSKTIQDRCCRMTDFQHAVYEFLKSQRQKNVLNSLSFLVELRKVCSHPSLVSPAILEAFMTEKGGKARSQKNIENPSFSGKFTSLCDLLQEHGCPSRKPSSVSSSASNNEDVYTRRHQFLIFFHMRRSLDMTFKMLQHEFPRLSFLCLHGSLSLKQREQVVSSFQSDPLIDGLLLTTSVGGLGLNLTQADTVIFMEHSWNPFIDQQAMDRAHRLGQKRAVHVYRLITLKSIEEDVMNLQMFKRHLASTVIPTASTEGPIQRQDVLRLLEEAPSRLPSIKKKNERTRKKKEKEQTKAAIATTSEIPPKDETFDFMKEILENTDCHLLEEDEEN